MIGLSLLVLPLALWEGIKRVKTGVKGQEDSPDAERDILLFLLIWAFLPAIILSFSCNKEVSYVLPSYSAVALLVAWWLDKRLSHKASEKWRGSGWFGLAFVVAIASFFLTGLDAVTYITTMIAALAFTVPILLFYLWKNRSTEAVFLISSLMLCAVIIGNSPNVLYELRLKKKCFAPLARSVWSKVGQNDLYLYLPKDTLRGSIPFYGDRLSVEIDRPQQLRSVLLAGQRNFVLMRTQTFEDVRDDPLIRGLYVKRSLPDFNLINDYVLLAGRKEAEAHGISSP